jgi:hypothetical protein
MYGFERGSRVQEMRRSVRPESVAGMEFTPKLMEYLNNLPEQTGDKLPGEVPAWFLDDDDFAPSGGDSPASQASGE